MDDKTNIKEQLEALLPNWKVMDNGDGNYDLESYSPAGEDLILSLHGDDLDELADDAHVAWADFDAEEHAASWYGANRGEPGSLRALLDDADEIDGMYEEVYETLRRAALA